jgi:hypothetical protein
MFRQRRRREDRHESGATALMPVTLTTAARRRPAPARPPTGSDVVDCTGVLRQLNAVDGGRPDEVEQTSARWAEQSGGRFGRGDVGEVTALAMRSVGADVYIWIVPPGPTGTITMFGRTSPVSTLRFEEFGSGLEPGKTVTKPRALTPAAVTLSATAATPAPGRPPAPSTASERVSPLANLYRSGGTVGCDGGPRPTHGMLSPLLSSLATSP